MSKLFLIDSNSIIHRCFHALPTLTSSKEKKPIQAVYGLASILLKLYREDKPDYIAACFDRPEPTFRKEIYKEYKAQRPETPDNLVAQIEEAHHLLGAFGIKIFELPGYEADDIIASLAEKFKSISDLKIIILSSDMDILQVVDNEKVVAALLKKGISETVIYSNQKVKEKLGIYPNQLVEYKALVGDPSDNIKGVPGIGRKTAARLLGKFGSIDGVLRNCSEEKIKKVILEHIDAINKAKKLVVLRRDAPLYVKDITDLKSSTPIKAREYFKRHGFNTLIKRLAELNTLL